MNIFFLFNGREAPAMSRAASLKTGESAQSALLDEFPFTPVVFKGKQND